MRFHFLIFGVLPFLCAPVQAQTETRQDVLDSMEECRAISVAFMREACLQAADTFLAGLDEQVATAQQPAPVATSSELELAEIEAARAALEQERAALEKSRAALAAGEAKQADAERRATLDKLGLEQADRDDEQVAATITIVRIAPSSQKKDTFFTSDGDRLVRFPTGWSLRAPTSLPATARLERRFLGSTWLTFDEHPSRAYKVRVIRKED